MDKKLNPPLDLFSRDSPTHRSLDSLDTTDSLVLPKSPPPHSDSPYSSFTELFDSLSHLYTEFYNDFASRIKNRLKSKHPCGLQSNYILEVDHDFRKTLKQKLVSLSSTHLEPQLLTHYTNYIQNFIDLLANELSTLQGKHRLLRLVSLTEAYSTLSNASQEMSRIVSPIFKGCKRACKTLHDQRFYESIVKPATELIKYAHEGEPHAKVMDELLDIEHRLEAIYHATNPFLKETMESDSSSDEEARKESFQKLSVDEVVSFINTPRTKHPRRKKPRKEGKAALLPPEPDDEIEEFKKRIDSAPVPQTKLKPHISSSYLSALKRLLNKKMSPYFVLAACVIIPIVVMFVFYVSLKDLKFSDLGVDPQVKKTS